MVSVIGHFGMNSDQRCGQAIKTRIVTEEIERRFGSDRVRKLDTEGGVKTLLRAGRMAKDAFEDADNVIILPAQNALQVFGPLVSRQKKHHPDVKIHYVVIGGWLPEFIKSHKFLIPYLHSFNGIYVETSGMKTALEKMGFSNVVIMPNCKELNVLREEELVYSVSEPLKLCTFSRIMKEKGIEDAVNAVREINDRYGRTVYQLDIYGQVQEGQAAWFEQLKRSFPSYIRYGGVVPYDQSVEVLKNYFALLFPTHFYTEGIPGTVLDAFAAGIPIVSAKWENIGDLIDDQVTGIGYGFDDPEGLKNVLLMLAENPEQVVPMKAKCLLEAKKYTPGEVVKLLWES